MGVKLCMLRAIIAVQFDIFSGSLEVTVCFLCIFAHGVFCMTHICVIGSENGSTLHKYYFCNTGQHGLHYAVLVRDLSAG